MQYHIKKIFTPVPFISSRLPFKLSSKFPLGLMPLLLLPYSLGSQALSASTMNVIQGTEPYLTFDGGKTKVTTTDGLFSIILSDGATITPTTNESSPSNPIELPDENDTFANVGMIIPTSTNSINLNDLVTSNNYWGDDDGDGLEVGDITASGNVTLTITDKDNKTVKRNDVLSICNAPYKVELSSLGGSLSTRYGIPDTSTFTGGKEVYYINPKVSPTICFVRPSLRYGSKFDNNWRVDFAGPDTIWSADKGFILQSTGSASYDNHFPTTGANGLYFDLDIAGTDASQLTWSPVTAGEITATITNATSTSVRITLTGPEAKDRWNDVSPDGITVPNLPQTFELVGRDNSGNAVLKYGFKLQKWFVNRGSITDIPSGQASWCKGLGYRLPQVKDLTNAVCSGPNVTRQCQGSVGATPSSEGNHYQRQIGAGLFTEWGAMASYPGSNFANVNAGYLTSDATDIQLFNVYSYSGAVHSYGKNFRDYGVCVTP
ncbi:hypothetical protein [Gilliamella intestini]|uniref:Uncharacterized protein n=1 Tax=Gilliamella intestini TaxID=1798183 RepID=A0A1C3YTB6_9GAMM|nr:hypothetical protein [Gilliamella intestini]SCB73313.1 hypothetical protein GA0061080_100186 [Gilliamella intestini]